MRKVTLTHPDLGTAKVPESSVTVFAKRGWVPVEEVRSDPAPEAPASADPPVTGATPTTDPPED